MSHSSFNPKPENLPVNLHWNPKYAIPMSKENQGKSGSLTEGGLWDTFAAIANNNPTWVNSRSASIVKSVMPGFHVLLNKCTAIEPELRAQLLLRFEQNHPEFYEKYIVPILNQYGVDKDVAVCLQKLKGLGETTEEKKDEVGHAALSTKPTRSP